MREAGLQSASKIFDSDISIFYNLTLTSLTIKLSLSFVIFLSTKFTLNYELKSIFPRCISLKDTIRKYEKVSHLNALTTKTINMKSRHFSKRNTEKLIKMFQFHTGGLSSFYV